MTSNAPAGINWNPGYDPGFALPTAHVVSDTVATNSGNIAPTASNFYQTASWNNTFTLSNENTAELLKANVLNPNILKPFTNTFTAGVNGAYYNLYVRGIEIDPLQYKIKVAPGTSLTWDDEFIPNDGSTPTDVFHDWTSTTETETPVYQITGANLESGPSGTHEIIPILIERDGQPITSKNNIVVIGQQINSSLYAPGLDITSYQWDVPGVGGDAFSDFEPDANDSGYTALEPKNLTGPSASFYWQGDEGSIPITCTVTLHGQPRTFTATLNVRRPDGDIIATVNNNVAVDTNYHPFSGMLCLHFGNNLGTGAEGMSFLATTITPPNDATGKPFTGDFEWIQVINSDVFTDTLFNGTLAFRASYGLDSTYPYNIDPRTGAVIFQQNPVTDSPGNLLPNPSLYIQYTRNFSATMFLMWRPNNLPAGENAVWVPLKSVDWSWSAVVTSPGTQNATWSLQTSPPPSSPGPPGTLVSEHLFPVEPQWTKNSTTP